MIREHFEMLKKGSATWNAWRMGNPELIPDLRGCDLSWSDLNGADLSGCDLSGCDLSWSDLRECDLRGCDLHRANLDYAVWNISCKDLHQKLDCRLLAQRLYHFMAQENVDTDNSLYPLYLRVRNNPDVIEFANTFHRATECGKIKEV